VVCASRTGVIPRVWGVQRSDQYRCQLFTSSTIESLTRNGRKPTADDLVRLYLDESEILHRSYNLTRSEQQRCPIQIINNDANDNGKNGDNKTNSNNSGSGDVMMEMVAKSDASDVLSFFVDETRDIDNRHKPAQTLSFSIFRSHLLSQLWRIMPLTEQQRFIDRYNSAFMAVLTPCAPASGERLLRHVRRQKLSYRSRIMNVTVDTSSSSTPYRQFIATFGTTTPSLLSLSTTITERYDMVINGIGSAGFSAYPTDTPFASSVITSLMTNGLAQAHPFGGFVLDTSCLRVLPSSPSSSSSSSSSMIYTIGQEVRGEEWLPANFFSLIDHIQRIVPSLVSGLSLPSTVKPSTSSSTPIAISRL
jgi:hypothetical protein